MTFGRKKEVPVIPVTPSMPKSLTYEELLSMQLADIESIIDAKLKESRDIRNLLMWVKATPHVQENMQAIWERLKPR